MGKAESEGGVEGHVFFVEHGLGNRVVPSALEAAGRRVERHGDYLDQGVDDPDWINLVAEKGWVALTKDRRIGTKDRRVRSDDLERKAVYYGKVRMFTLRAASLPGDQMAEAFAKALPAMEKILEQHDGPFIARVHRDGRVEMWREGEDLIRDA